MIGGSGGGAHLESQPWGAEAHRSLCPQGQPGLQELLPGQAPKLQTNPVSKNKKQKSAILIFKAAVPFPHPPAMENFSLYPTSPLV